MSRLFTVLMASLLLMSLAQAGETSKNCFIGYAYSEDGSTLLYTEHHEQSLRQGHPLQWDVVYRSANEAYMGAAPGEVIARKKFDFSDNRTVPVYTLDILRAGYREGIRHDNGNWRMLRRKSQDAATETESFKYKPPMAADSGFDPFVKKNFKALMSGETVTFDFVAAGRLDVVGLRAYKLGETEFQGRRAVKFKADLNSLFRYVVSVALEMTYDAQTRELLQYQGVSNMHNAHGDTFAVIIKYLDEPPRGAEKTQTPQGCSET